MSLEILSPGFFTTVQDRGRVGYKKYGVGVGGAMDELALRAANALVGNDATAAALEITLSGLTLRARDKCLVAVTGARFALRVDARALPMNTALFIRAGAVLEFGARESGARAYLALAGGVHVPLVLNARATDVRGGFGGFEGRALRAGDVIEAGATRIELERAGLALPESFEEYYESRAPFRVIEGPHRDFFDDAARADFFSGEFTIGALSDRMGLRLQGNKVARAAGELLSCGVTRGAVQIPPAGQPIVLMADHQTTGGYPIIATVIRADQPRLAQKIAGEKISFHAVSLAQALHARQELETMLSAGAGAL